MVAAKKEENEGVWRTEASSDARSGIQDERSPGEISRMGFITPGMGAETIENFKCPSLLMGPGGRWGHEPGHPSSALSLSLSPDNTLSGRK